MIAIAESGSTKCDWVFLGTNNEPELRLKTQGFNPYFHDSEYVSKTLTEDQEFSGIRDQVTHVYFYGAGCSSTTLCSIVEQGLTQVFPQASIRVDHDLAAAAYSLYEGEPTIACILGTGSNACFFDGKQVSQNVRALGFILGDEASGCYFGKQLLTDFFYHNLPVEIHRAFTEQFQLAWGEVVDEVYGNIHANVYLASFMPFIASFSDHEYVKEMVQQGLGKFIDTHVTGYPDYERYTVGFVGTIAHVFSDMLTEELEKRNCRPGAIIQSPVDRLIAYHVKYLLPMEV